MTKEQEEHKRNLRKILDDWKPEPEKEKHLDTTERIERRREELKKMLDATINFFKSMDIL